MPGCNKNRLVSIGGACTVMNLLTIFLLFVVISFAAKPYPVIASDSIRDFWFSGAEINHYTLDQSRYGQQHPGHAEFIFVTEPFLTQQQVKNETGGQPSTDVLKLNTLRTFNTGIYSYRTMTSTFQPIDLARFPHALKTTTSVQDWCGQSFQQINRKHSQWQVELRSWEWGRSKQRIGWKLARRCTMDPSASRSTEIADRLDSGYTRCGYSTFWPPTHKTVPGFRYSDARLRAHYIYTQLSGITEIVKNNLWFKVSIYHTCLGGNISRRSNQSSAYPSNYEQRILVKKQTGRPTVAQATGAGTSGWLTATVFWIWLSIP